jgi:hypothetical protein
MPYLHRYSSRFRRTSPTVSGRLEQTMRAGEVSIGAVEGWETESRPYVGPSLRSQEIEWTRTEACALCGRRWTPLDSALMDRTGVSARKPARNGVMVRPTTAHINGRHRDRPLHRSEARWEARAL